QWIGQSSSRLGRSVVTQVTGATQFTTPFSAQTYQIRVVSTFPIWATIGSTAVVTANSAAAFERAGILCRDFRAGPQLHFNINVPAGVGYVHGDDIMSPTDLNAVARLSGPLHSVPSVADSTHTSKKNDRT